MAINEQAVDELVLYIDNDSDLYRQRAVPIMKNLAKKILKGNYDSAKAVKLWKYLADAGAQKYTKEFGDSDRSSYGVFTTADRKAAAEDLSKAFESAVKNKEVDLEDLARR